MRVTKFLLLVTALLVLVLPTAAQEMTPEATTSAALGEPIIINLAALLPEGVEYDAANDRFLFGSLSQGTIFQIEEGGEAEPFIEDEDLVSTVGIHVDAANNRLLVSNSDSSMFSDPSATGTAQLAAYDLETGERLFLADLGALLPDNRHFANDVTIDADGNAYVTDSFSPVIYRVDMDGNAEIFIESDRLTSDNFGLNGIDYHPDGYLLAAVSGSAAVYKIPLDDPEGLTEVALSEPLAIDGMVLSPDGSRFYAVADTFSGAGGQQLVEVTSDDDWATATVTNRAETGGEATTVALRDGAPHFINVYFGNPQAEQYEIVPVTFEGVE
ncbi:MAG: SMP-30/gluconolactonase/LRE family protein [Chloroflexi bacterium]|nr:SMP-30/gluconolactonase/LRE family protein [Chloroflexota bacterium]